MTKTASVRNHFSPAETRNSDSGKRLSESTRLFACVPADIKHKVMDAMLDVISITRQLAAGAILQLEASSKLKAGFTINVQKQATGMRFQTGDRKAPADETGASTRNR